MERTAMFSMRLDKEIKEKLLDLCRLDRRPITHEVEWLVLKEWMSRQKTDEANKTF
jgi:hypothetical protein